MNSDSIVADVGSGTGISSEMFLVNGNVVFAIEPNREMREAAERLLAKYGERFRSITGTAEATTLPEATCDFVVSGQAFHWFDRPAAKKEFQRILKPGGFIVLIWNERNIDSTPFLRDYEKLLLTFGTDYEQVNHARIDETLIAEFFNPAPFQLRGFPNSQVFDFDGLKGRLLSSSYAPDEQHPRHQPMLVELERIFREHARNGQVIFDYDTKVYFGSVG